MCNVTLHMQNEHFFLYMLHFLDRNFLHVFYIYIFFFSFVIFFVHWFLQKININRVSNQCCWAEIFSLTSDYKRCIQLWFWLLQHPLVVSCCLFLWVAVCVGVKHNKCHPPKTKIILLRAKRLLYRVASRVSRFRTFVRVLCNCSLFEVPLPGLLAEGEACGWSTPSPAHARTGNFNLFIVRHLLFICCYLYQYPIIRY